MAPSLRLSQDHEQFCALLKCPRCHQFPIVASYFNVDGSAIPDHTSIADMGASSLAECPRCRQRWPVFAAGQASLPTGKAPAPLTSGPPSEAAELEIATVELVETDRVEEPLGSDRRVIDNSKGTGRLTRRLMISKEWSKTYSIDFQRAVTASGEAGFKLLTLADLKGKIEGNLKSQYSISETTKNSYTDEVSVDIEPQTKVTYAFQWKCIWQNGVVRCLSKSNQEVARIPFRVAIGVTFDIASE